MLPKKIFHLSNCSSYLKYTVGSILLFKIAYINTSFLISFFTNFHDI